MNNLTSYMVKITPFFDNDDQSVELKSNRIKISCSDDVIPLY